VLVVGHVLGGRPWWTSRRVVAPSRSTRSISTVVLPGGRRPSFAYRGNIVSFNPSKHVVSLMFHRGAEIPGTHPRLEGDGRLARTMRFSDLDQLEAGRADLEAVIRARCHWKAGSPAPG
jgi:hypothetical protein